MESQNNMHDGLLDDVVQNSQELPNRSLLHFPQKFNDEENYPAIFQELNDEFEEEKSDDLNDIHQDLNLSEVILKKQNFNYKGSEYYFNTEYKDTLYYRCVARKCKGKNLLKINNNFD